ncbi:hypothetical protein AB1Y20_017043 [Prymnesium parvum]|uniref:Protein O-GlcNAc transferase n=1 Tax=Prymnesium parvum TaxID=97485 RepID=A0AB34IB59_PRYPA
MAAAAALLCASLAKQWVAEWDQPAWRQVHEEAMALAQQGRAADALPLFREAYEMHGSAESLHNVAVALEQTGRLREAHETYLRVLNTNAHHAPSYDLLLALRHRLLVDVRAFVAAERSRHAALPPSSGRCAARRAAVPPAPRVELPHLVNRSHPTPPAWGGPAVLVVAHWREDLGWLHSPPFDAFPRVVYQRHHADRPFYSPNFGFEAGVYLQFIVEHYDALPEQVVFLQGDPASHVDMRFLAETIRCLRAGRVRYFSFSKMPFLIDRDLQRYTGVHSPASVAPFIHRMPACARRLLDYFGVEPPAEGALNVSTYCCATFTASRDAIRRHPWSVWRHVYEVVASGAAPCIWADGGGDAPGLHDLNEGFVMEHLWHAIFGEPLRSTALRGDETCAIASCGKYCPDAGAPELGLFAALIK